MIRLVALDQANNAQTTLELEGSPSISLNLAVAKPGETMQRHAPYSQTFRLPFTNTNNVFFAHFYEVTLSDGDFDPTQKTEVLIFEDGVQVIRGAMQLRAVRLMAQVYEVNVLGDTADLFAEMGSKLLEAAFRDGNDYVTTYNYNNTAANVILSQDLGEDITTGQVGDGTIIVPFADHGLSRNQQPLVAQVGYGLRDPNSGSNGLYADMLKPSIKLATLVDRIITEAGFYYSSDFFASGLFTSIYMTLGTETENLTTGEVNQCLVYQGSDQLVEITDASAESSGWVNVELDDETTAGTYDPDGAFNPVSHVYQAQETGVHRFFVRLQVQTTFANSGSGDTLDVIGRIAVGNVSQGSATVQMVEGSSPSFVSDDNRRVEFTVECVMDAGDVAQTQVYYHNHTFGDSITVKGVVLGLPTTRFQCLRAPGGEVNVPKLLPRIKQKEFMADLCQRFNLVIEADPDNPKRLYIEPYADWIGDGVDTYWTEKLDMDKERTLMPTSSLKSSRILFADKESGDVGNAYMAGTLGRAYGSYDQDIDDEFSTGELTNNPVFSPFFVYPVPTLQGDPHTINDFFLIHRSYEKDGVGVKHVSQPPKLFFAVGSQDIQDTYYIGGTGFSSFLFCSPFNESPVDGDTQSLVWNSEDLPFSATNALLNGDPNPVPAIGLHRSYWSTYLADIYDADARVFEAHLYLTPSDVRTVRFNDRFHILGATYKLTEISGYQIGTGESVLCKFLRDIERSTIGACQNVPSTSNANGTVTFVDPDGNDVTDPGQECCESFGYYYDATTNTCRWQNPADDTGDPVPPYPPTDPQDPVPNTNGDTPGPVSPFGSNVVTTDEGSGTSTIFSTFNLSAETIDATATDATAPLGTDIQVDENTIATGLVRVATTTVGGTAGTAFESSFETWRFLANGRAGTVTFTKTSGTTLTSGSPGTRNPSASISGGVLTFQVTGLADTIINWTLEVEMVRMYATNEVEFRDALLTEAGSRLAGINDRVIIQE